MPDNDTSPAQATPGRHTAPRPAGPRLPLAGGRSIPQLGLGTYGVGDEVAEEVVHAALAAGYRHVDTAQMYGNEAAIGRALASSGTPRDDVFVTTKLNNQNHLPDVARRSLEQSLEKLQLDRVDLFLIHWPLPTRYDGDFVTTWETMLEFVSDGLVTTAGVSNFLPDHLDRIVAATGVAPAVNQVEVHPYMANEEVRAANARHGAVTTAWSPLARGGLLAEPAVVAVAEQTGRTPAQVVLRWHVQRGDAVIPKSVTPARIAENAAIFDFTLTPDQMRAISDLDRGPEGRTGGDPATMDWIPED